jgi:hypothetical protein
MNRFTSSDMTQLCKQRIMRMKWFISIGKLTVNVNASWSYVSSLLHYSLLMSWQFPKCYAYIKILRFAYITNAWFMFIMSVETRFQLTHFPSAYSYLVLLRAADTSLTKWWKRRKQREIFFETHYHRPLVQTWYGYQSPDWELKTFGLQKWTFFLLANQN